MNSSSDAWKFNLKGEYEKIQIFSLNKLNQFISPHAISTKSLVAYCVVFPIIFQNQ